MERRQCPVRSDNVFKYMVEMNKRGMIVMEVLLVVFLWGAAAMLFFYMKRKAKEMKQKDSSDNE